MNKNHHYYCLKERNGKWKMEIGNLWALHRPQETISNEILQQN